MITLGTPLGEKVCGVSLQRVLSVLDLTFEAQGGSSTKKAGRLRGRNRGKRLRVKRGVHSSRGNWDRGGGGRGSRRRNTSGQKGGSRCRVNRAQGLRRGKRGRFREIRGRGLQRGSTHNRQPGVGR
ncbi:hypothetical protein YC2023_109785 [Brassica napus]